jgi:hypothetical protein
MANLNLIYPQILQVVFDGDTPSDDAYQFAFVFADGAEGEVLLKVPTDRSADPTDRTYTLRSSLDSILRSLPQDKEIGVCLSDSNDSIAFREPVKVDLKLLRRCYDPILGTWDRAKFYKKNGRVAVLTHVYNEGKMLSFWERYYGNHFGYENLFVIDDGSDDGSIALLNDKTNVIRIPKGDLDHWNMSEYCGYFQRFLLKRYAWVINTDCDEMLVTEQPFHDLMATLPVGIYCPELAISAVHDLRNEADFDFSGSVCAQRSVFVKEKDMFRKPMLSSVPTTWWPGFHYCAEPSSMLPQMWMVHLRYIDFGRLSIRHKNWSNKHQTEIDKMIYKSLPLIQDKSAIEIVDQAETEIRELLDSANRIERPGWITL